MSDLERDESVEELAEMLRAARPLPAEEWVESVEARLLGRRSLTRSYRPAWLGAGLAVGLTCLLLLIGLVGAAGPLAPSGVRTVEAGPTCERTFGTERQTFGEVVERPGGGAEVMTRPQTVTTEKRLCLWPETPRDPEADAVPAR